MKSLKAWMVIGATLGAMGSAMASGYVVDGSGNPVRSASGECWRSGSWNPEQAAGQGCDSNPPSPKRNMECGTDATPSKKADDKAAMPHHKGHHGKKRKHKRSR